MATEQACNRAILHFLDGKQRGYSPFLGEDKGVRNHFLCLETSTTSKRKRCQEPILGAGILIACSVLSRGVAYSRVDHFAGGPDAAFPPLAPAVSSFRLRRVSREVK